MADVWRYRSDISGLPGGPGLMTLHFDPAVGGFSAQDAVDAVAAFIAAVDVFISNSVTFDGSDEMEVLDVSSGQQTAALAVTGYTQAGDDSATMLPPINQVLVRWNTSLYLSGRRLAGKTFLPGFCEDSNEPGGVLQGAVNSAVAAAAQALADESVGQCVYSRTHHAIAGVATATVWNQFAVQTGRRDG